jgi:hypothetical protein
MTLTNQVQMLCFGHEYAQKDIIEILRPFENKWVALVNNEVVAAGETVAQVKENAEKAGQTTYVFYFVPSCSISLAPYP